MKTIAGIDEAGRGPVLGPMVIAGLLFREEDLPRLKDLGVKDSKKLAPQRREELYPQILSLSLRQCIVKVGPGEIDESRAKGIDLNTLEAKLMAYIIDQLEPDTVIIGSVDILPERFKSKILRFLTRKDVQIVCLHHAEDFSPAVAAASIIAKCLRDRDIAALKEKYGDFGSGYAHDPATRRFLQEWVKKHGSLPPFARCSWKTSRECLQPTLLSFLEEE